MWSKTIKVLWNISCKVFTWKLWYYTFIKKIKKAVYKNVMCAFTLHIMYVLIWMYDDKQATFNFFHSWNSNYSHIKLSSYDSTRSRPLTLISSTFQHEKVVIIIIHAAIPHVGCKYTYDLKSSKRRYKFCENKILFLSSGVHRVWGGQRQPRRR